MSRPHFTQFLFLRPIQGPALASTTHFDIQSSKTLATSILSKNKPGLRLISLFKCALQYIQSRHSPGFRSADFVGWLGAGMRGGLRPISRPATTPDSEVVGLGGLEPPTSPLSGARSNHLSYRPKAVEFSVRSQVVELVGIEPTTPCLQSRCSPS